MKLSQAVKARETLDCSSSVHFRLQYNTFQARIHPSRPSSSSQHHVSSRMSLRPHWDTARMACSMSPNMTPLATDSICKQSKTLARASPLAAWPMTLVKA